MSEHLVSSFWAFEIATTYKTTCMANNIPNLAVEGIRQGLLLLMIIILTLAETLSLCQIFRSLSCDPLQWQVHNKGNAAAICTLVTQERKRLQDDKAKKET